MASKEKNPEVPEKKSALKVKKSGSGESSWEEFVHRFKTHPFLFTGTVIVLIITIIAFVLVPALVTDEGGAVSQLNFGSYDRVPINYVPGSYFAQVQSQLARNYQSQLDDSNYQTILYQIWRQSFEETVVHLGVLDEMRLAGYTPPKKEVDREVALLPEFQVDGRFSPIRYQQLDAATRMNLWLEVQESMAIRQYYGDIDSLQVSSGESSFLSSLSSPKRSFEMASFPFSSYPDSELILYGEAHPDLFQTVHLSVITLSSSEREAAQVLSSIQNGTIDFEEAARSNSKDSYADKGGDMGIKMANELSTEIPDAAQREAVLALSKGTLSPVVKVPSGWAFFRAEEDPRPADLQDSAGLDKIRAYLLSFERGRIEDWLIAQADAFITQARDEGFDAACTAAGISKRTFGPLPLNYGDIPLFPTVSSFGISELASASTSENFWRAAFHTPLASPSSPLVLGDQVVVLLPTEELPSDDTAAGMEAYYSYWLNSMADQNVRNYFLTNPKLQDKFLEGFFKYIFSPS